MTRNDSIRAGIAEAHAGKTTPATEVFAMLDRQTYTKQDRQMDEAFGRRLMVAAASQQTVVDVRWIHRMMTAHKVISDIHHPQHQQMVDVLDAIPGLDG